MRTALGGRGAAPLPITFTELELLVVAELSSVAIVIGFDGVSNDQFARAVGAAVVVIELANGVTDIVLAKFRDTGVDCHGEFSVEDTGAVLAVNVDVVFTETWVDAVDDGLEVFVDQKGGSAKDHKVVVEGGNGVVEIALAEDQVHQALTLGEPEADRGGLG